MLLQLRQFIAEQQSVSLVQLARAFHVAPDALEAMLVCWEMRGVISRVQSADCNSRCHGCKPSTAVYYQYVQSS